MQAGHWGQGSESALLGCENTQSPCFDLLLLCLSPRLGHWLCLDQRQPPGLLLQRWFCGPVGPRVETAAWSLPGSSACCERRGGRGGARGIRGPRWDLESVGPSGRGDDQHPRSLRTHQPLCGCSGAPCRYRDISHFPVPAVSSLLPFF